MTTEPQSAIQPVFSEIHPRLHGSARMDNWSGKMVQGRVDAACVLPSSRDQVMRRRRHYAENSSRLVVLPHSLLSLQVTPGYPEENWGILGVTPPVSMVGASMVGASMSENPCKRVLDTWYSSRNCNQTLLQTFLNSKMD